MGLARSEILKSQSGPQDEQGCPLGVSSSLRERAENTAVLRIMFQLNLYNY